MEKTTMSSASTVPNLPENKSQNVNNFNLPSTHNKKRKRKNKNKKPNKQWNAKKKVFKRKPIHNSASKAVFTMSSWAEQFTLAATWQLKHQLAYWKAKATSLQYENEVLHDIIRKNHYANNTKNCIPSTSKVSDLTEDKSDKATKLYAFEADISVEEGRLGEWTDTEGMDSQSVAVDMDTQIDGSDDCSDKDIEVSEEFIQFLMVNAKHKEEVRLERERLKTLEEEAATEEREKKLKERRHYGLSSQELYGDKWQKISALEMSMKSKFMANVDSTKPAYWPVIPFNFDTI